MAADLALLTEVSSQITSAQAQLTGLSPLSLLAVLATTRGWGVARSGYYQRA